MTLRKKMISRMKMTAKMKTTIEIMMTLKLKTILKKGFLYRFRPKTASGGFNSNQFNCDCNCLLELSLAMNRSTILLEFYNNFEVQHCISRQTYHKSCYMGKAGTELYFSCLIIWCLSVDLLICGSIDLLIF